MKLSQWSFSRVVLSFVMTGSILLTGCASTGSSMIGGSPAADPRLTQGNGAKFFSTSGFQACAAAAGAGVLACALSNSSNKAQCAVIAGIAACGVAMGANYYFDQRRSEYSDTTERLQLMSSDIQADTDKVASRTATLQQVIRDDEERIAQIQKSIKTQQLDAAKAQKEIAEIDSNIAQMRKDLAGMRNKVTEYEKTAVLERQNGAGDEVASIETEITKMNTKVVALQQEVDGLYSQRSAITLG
ncbi:MAG: hypothetical protein Q7J46_18245 [Pseudomonas sp.]|nr:hypothetical protein [Pseudomonas sp.]